LLLGLLVLEINSTSDFYDFLFGVWPLAYLVYPPRRCYSVVTVFVELTDFMESVLVFEMLLWFRKMLAEGNGCM